MRAALVVLILGLMMGCSKKELQLVSVTTVNEYVWKNVATYRADEDEVIAVIDVILGEKHSYDYPPSIMLTNEPLDPNSRMEDDDTWYYISESSGEILMDENWVEISEEGSSRNLRLVAVIKKNVDYGFLNIENHAPIRIQLPAE